MKRIDPVIFVIGCTGTGKSDLGVAIAKKYKGEVISVDSMQFYKGLDIATNKITEEEAEGIPHHMMSFLDPSTTSKYHVHSFKEEALKLITDIRKRQKIPIIVGGTTYYAESVLYENNMIETPDQIQKESSSDSDDSEPETSDEIKLTNQELWNKLNEVDPESAKYLHPNNRSRVSRAFQIFKLTGKPKSEFLRKQKEGKDVDLPGKLRFENSLVIYMDAQRKVLDERLDSRVEKMLKMGLKNELIEFYEEHKNFIDDSSYGVMQCIGLKEFVPWLKMEDRESKAALEKFKIGCEDVKLHTRQYAVRQRRWYSSRFLKRSDADRKMASTKKLDTSDKNCIISDGMAIVDEWMNGTDFYEMAPLSENEVLSGEKTNVLLKCDVCDMIMTGTNNWDSHIAGKRHKSLLAKKKKLEATEKKELNSEL